MKYVFGIILVFLSVYILGGTYIPILKEEINYRVSRYQAQSETKEPVPLDTDFGILIPKIGANAHVVKNVDPYNSQAYQKALSLGVAHAKGTGLPGDGDNIFIFSHSSTDFFQASKYNAIFYLLNKLTSGDIVKLFYEGREYHYQVQTKQIVPPSALDYLTYKPDEETLTLMTCWPPGTSINRLVIQADLKEQIKN